MAGVIILVISSEYFVGVKYFNKEEIMKLRSRLEFFLAKVAGRDVNINTLIPAGATTMAERLLLEISDRINRADRGYVSIDKVKDYLYEIYYDNLDYDEAYEYFLSNGDIENIGMCTSVRNGQFYGRNLDWLYNEQAEFVVHTSRSAGRYATIGVAGNMSKLTDKFVSSGRHSNDYRIMPFKL